MTTTERILISQYAASELAGALLLGKWARKTKDAYLRAKYTWHCAEEARHAWLWTELLQQESKTPTESHDEQGDQYFFFAKEVQDDIDFLAFVHVYEWRVPFHLSVHLKAKDLSEPTKKLMQQLIKEEGAHLSWIADYLQEEQRKSNSRIAEAITKFGEIEERTYKEHILRLQKCGGGFKELGDLLEQHLPQYEAPWHNFLSPTHAKQEAAVG